jgi:2-polyprenyl-3-methyl-5-hydroxy-6-metoxy-1,4-benzoquinol methylase
MNPFDAKARSWDTDPAKADRARKVADLIAARVPTLADARVLEVGAGTGLLGFALRDRSKHVTLADSSTEMLAVATGKLRAAGPCNVDVVALDLERDPPPAARYDVVCALLVLHHVHDTAALLRTLHGVLEPGGYLCLSDLEKEDGAFHGAGFDGHNGFAPEELQEAIEGAGFTDVEFQPAFEIRKSVDGTPRSFPAFLAIARRP